MYIIKVNSEWDLGISEFYMSEERAREEVRKAIPAVRLDGTLAEYEDENLISFEWIWVVEDDE